MVFGSWGIQAAGPVLARRGVGLGRDRLHERREPSNWETVSESFRTKAFSNQRMAPCVGVSMKLGCFGKVAYIAVNPSA